MNEIELKQRNHYTRISMIMIIIGLIFLFYVGLSLSYSTKRFHQQVHSITRIWE
ncbi:hypothetical protein [Bacteroides neonati]|nr:hypothetical protein [Bacteroides neonati]MCP3895146.1 hypothetical protein [Bacteroides sp.]